MNLFQNIFTKDSRIRVLPYPFLGALSISNDIEYFSFEVFDELMRFLNTSDSTLLGQGIGTEVTSSLFFFSAYPNTFAYFRGTEQPFRRGKYAERIKEYLGSGWIDTNHSFGDFAERSAFRRFHAERCYEELNDLGIILSVYTDHGGEYNLQNVGPGSPVYHHGDVPESPYYHSDLLKPNGVEYVWSDSGMVIEKTTDDIDRRNISLPRRFRRWLSKSNENDGDNERLIAEWALQDSSIFKRFIRLRSTGMNAPNLSSLGYQLRLIDWEDFYRSRGVVIIYQHMGVLSRTSGVCCSATIDQIRSRPEVFLSPFYFLKHEQEQGRLWIAGVSRLLHYVSCVQNVSVSFDKAECRYDLACSKDIRNPEEAFQGLTIYHESPERPHLRYGSHDIEIVHNGPDETGRYSFSVPLKKYASIW